MIALSVLLLLILSCVAVTNSSSYFYESASASLIAPGSFPRAVQINKTMLTCVGQQQGATKSLVVFESHGPDGPFARVGTVAVEPNATAADLANCNLALTSTGRLVAAYRHHLNCTHGRPCGVFRIMSAQAVSPSGTQWLPPVTVYASRQFGLWEPFLFEARPPTLDVYYSRELSPSSQAPFRVEQDIVRQSSVDNGAHWTATFVTAVHTQGSRNGMPGVARLPDQSLLMVFEGFWSGGWGRFTVNGARSYDNGLTWPTNGRHLIFEAHNASRNAGAPQIASIASSLTPLTVQVVFMTNDNVSHPAAWPQSASAVSLAAVSLNEKTKEIGWSTTVRSVASPNAYWPGACVVNNHIVSTFQREGDCWSTLL